MASNLMVDDHQDASKFISLLICDEHPVSARGLAALLTDEAPDLRVLGVAFNGSDAQEMARRLAPDVVVMGIYMPGVSGIEATRVIRTSCPSIKVLMLTFSDLEADLVEALAAGATGYVTKDRDLPDIVAAVRAVHNGQLTFPARVADGFLGHLDANARHLTKEERTILLGVVEGKTNAQIGQEISVSERTVRRRVQEIYSKLKITDPKGAATYAARVSSVYASQAAVWSQSARRRLESAREKTKKAKGDKGSPQTP